MRCEVRLALVRVSPDASSPTPMWHHQILRSLQRTAPLPLVPPAPPPHAPDSSTAAPPEWSPTSCPSTLWCVGCQVLGARVRMEARSKRKPSMWYSAARKEPKRGVRVG